MNPKKKITKNDPAYYVPLPYAMAIKKTADEEVFERLFNGMKLDFRLEGVINTTIAITTYLFDEEIVLGYIPSGMISRIEGLIEHEDRLVVSLERKKCDRLKNAFWICIDELPELKSLGIDRI